MRKLLVFLFIGVFQFANAQDLPFGKSLQRITNNVYLLSNGKTIAIKADSINRLSSLRIGNGPSETPLRFFIPLDETTEIFQFSGKYGEVLIIQSYYFQPNGLAASIVNFSFLLLADDRVVDAQYSNSFFEGLRGIRYEKGRISIRTLKFMEYTGQDIPVCCLSNFTLNDSFRFEKDGPSTCIEYHAGTFKKTTRCSCEFISSPLVSNAK